ncbi:class I SAM-dependent methyltransferase [Halopenitus sp. H-Gu1]|uniref:class I SAM-dependent methyltransferase n=1 Tax=Halopenitus sp. H-Gu1 TaxID=3242697 RepID=UPI00359EFA6C
MAEDPSRVGDSPDDENGDVSPDDENGDVADRPQVRDPDPIATYDRIAAHFAKTREYAWPEVESFLDGRTATCALDIGCGNGRHTESLADRSESVVGLDASRGLLAEAVDRADSRGFEATFLQGDAASLPLRTGAVDVGVYVATIHHLRSRTRRIRSLNELARVLCDDGVALVSTWSTAHDRFDGRDGDSTDDATDTNGSEEGFDTIVDWTLPGGETVPRFYHIYAPAEFRSDLEASDLSIEDFEISSGNCYVVVRPDSGAR